MLTVTILFWSAFVCSTRKSQVCFARCSPSSFVSCSAFTDREFSYPCGWKMRILKIARLGMQNASSLLD